MEMEEKMKRHNQTVGICNVGDQDVADFCMMSESSSFSSSSSSCLSSNKSSFSCKSNTSSTRSKSRSSSFSKPSWLLSTIADLDERIKIVALNTNNSSREEEDEENKNGCHDSFAERCEAYYRTRPQLLALLHDLYNGYLSLAYRYCQTLPKNHPHRCHYASPISAVQFNHKLGFSDHDRVEDQEEEEEEYTSLQQHLVLDSDAESSVSYQTPPANLNLNSTVKDVDLVVAELVMKMVQFDIIVDELSMMERRWMESSRKMDLQRSLLEVLESERVILLNENSRLGYKMTVLGEENKGLVAETLFMKRKAGELARCVLKMREDHRVCMLMRKIEDLQGQIYSLEKTNKDYHQQLVKRDGLQIHLQHHAKKNARRRNGEATLEDCLEVHEGVGGEEKTVAKSSPRKAGSESSGKKILKWWGKVKNFDLLQCGPHF